MPLTRSAVIVTFQTQAANAVQAIFRVSSRRIRSIGTRDAGFEPRRGVLVGTSRWFNSALIVRFFRAIANCAICIDRNVGHINVGIKQCSATRHPIIAAK